MIDVPKSLGDPEYQAQLRLRLQEPHVAPLTAFVDSIRQERGCGSAVPYFDPADGGVDAECLFLFEAPGPNAVRSGFISRNNPDESAKNWLELNSAAGIPRERTVSWNIVPWYIGSGTRIRPATSSDVEDGLPYLLRLVELLPRLRLAVLAGGKAQRAAAPLRRARPDAELARCHHPSPMFINRRPGNRALLLSELREIADALG